MAKEDHQREGQRFAEEPNERTRAPGRIQPLSQRGCPVDRQARAPLDERQVQQQDDEQGGRGIDGPPPRTGPSRRGPPGGEVPAPCPVVLPPPPGPAPPGPVQPPRPNPPRSP